MLKTFPIDFIRQSLEQRLLLEHIKNAKYFGGKNQVNIMSFYEQLKSQDEVDRFVEIYRDLTDQQNRTGLILNGVLVSPENPSITNLYSSLIVPMSFTCSLRCILENRDQAIETINNLIEKLKGRKVDIAQLNCVYENGTHYSVPFVVGTVGQDYEKPTLKSGDFVGNVNSIIYLQDIIDNYIAKGVYVDYKNIDYLYCEYGGIIRVIKVDYEKGDELIDGTCEKAIEDSRYVTLQATLGGHLEIQELYPNASANVVLEGDEEITLELNNGKIEIVGYETQNNQEYTNIVITFDLGGNVDEICPGFDGTFFIEDESVYEILGSYSFIENDGSFTNIIFPPTHTSFEKYKLSFSFDAIRCDEPRNLNGKEYCEISFGGSATLVNNGVALGNDLLRVGIAKNKILAETTIELNGDIQYLEPLEMPSGNNANAQINQLVSNNFVSNTHTNAIALTLQYTFVVDNDIDLLKQWFNYARYGTQGITINDICPNLIYDTHEYWCSWGNYEHIQVLTKIVENIDIDNTESDTLTLSISMQIQGENN